MSLTKEDATSVLKEIMDPELGLDIWTLGLIYNVELKEGGKVLVTMTLTSPACPYGPMIIEEVRTGLQNKGFVEPEVDITFDPPWEPNEDVRILLGLTF